MIDNSAAISKALDILRNKKGNLFLTGRAGTGKTTFLERARKEFEQTRQVATVAFSGMAAVQAHGVTIHSFFKVGAKAYHPDGPELNERFNSNFNYREEKRKILQKIDLLFIDEVSMVRADLLDVMDIVLKTVRSSQLPFGGVQVCLVGDAFQLPPVVTDYEEKALLADAYPGSHEFFAARAFRNNHENWHAIELPEVMRQRDTAFIEVLNRIRIGRHTASDLAKINEQVVPPFAVGFELDEQILLTTTNARVSERNKNALAQLDTELHTYLAKVEGDFPEKDFPTNRELQLKVGALVMFVRNDKNNERRYYNGSIGIVTAMSKNGMTVKTKDGRLVNVVREQWDKIEYFYAREERRLRNRMTGSFTQFPIRLAYAITIHKSQGLTLDAAFVDLSGAFTNGQAYVALSRLKSFGGLRLQAPVMDQEIRVSSAAIRFQQWIDVQTSSGSENAFAKTGQGTKPPLLPRFPIQKLSSKPKESGIAIKVEHKTDANRMRTRLELENEIETLRKQRDELLRTVRKIQRAVGDL